MGDALDFIERFVADDDDYHGLAPLRQRALAHSRNGHDVSSISFHPVGAEGYDVPFGGYSRMLCQTAHRATSPERTETSSSNEEEAHFATLEVLLRREILNPSLSNQNIVASEFFVSEVDLQKILLLPQNLRKIMRNFQKCQKSCERFAKVYPVWKYNRRDVIVDLNGLADMVQQTKLNCNIARLVNSSTSVVGGALAITSAGLIPLTGGLAGILTIIGVAMMGTSQSSNLGTAATELILLKGKAEEAQKLIKIDLEYFRDMCTFFRHASEYVDSVNAVLDFEVFAKFLTDAKALFAVLGDVVNQQTLEDVLRSLLQSIAGKQLPFLSIIKPLFTSPNFVALLQELMRIHSENPLLFESIVVTVKIFLQVGMNLEILETDLLSSAVTSIFKLGSSTAGSAVGKAISRTLFSSLSVAIDLVSLTLTSVEVHKGSKCALEEQFREVSKQMSKEFDVVKLIYAELRKRGLV